MSSPNRLKSTRTRAKSDFYPTPFSLIVAVMAMIKNQFSTSTYTNSIGPPRFLDAGSGQGRWGWGAAQVYENYIMDGVEIDKRHLGLFDGPNPTLSPLYDYYRTLYSMSFLNFKNTGVYPYDFVIGNPPFSMSEAFVWHALTLAPVVVFLLRLPFMTSDRRTRRMFGQEKFWPEEPVFMDQSNKSGLHTVWNIKRPSFFSASASGVARTTDMHDYGIFVFVKPKMGPPQIRWLHWDYLKDSPDNTFIAPRCLEDMGWWWQDKGAMADEKCP